MIIIAYFTVIVGVLFAASSGSEALLLLSFAPLFALLLYRERHTRRFHDALLQLDTKLQPIHRKRLRISNQPLNSLRLINRLDDKVSSILAEMDDLKRQASFGTILTTLPKKSSNSPGEISSFVDALSDFIRDRLAADLVMIQLYENTNMQCCSFAGLDSERARSLLADWIHPITSTQPKIYPGNHPIEAGRGRISGLSHYGLSHLLCESATVQAPENKEWTVVICAAYSKELKNCEPELLLLKGIAKKSLKELSLPATKTASDLVSAATAGNAIERDHLAHISHDLRSPLNNIKAILNLLRLQENDTSQRELIASAIGNCSHVEELVEGILDYTQHKAGKLQSKAEPFEIRNCLEDIIENFRVSAELKKLKLELEHGESLWVYADKRQIRRILSNLVSNALKYTAKGSVSLAVKQLQAGKVSIAVKDSGSGMNQNQVQQLFTPFTRFDTSNQTGIGLGLAVSKVLAEKNSGLLKVQSDPGKGSVFMLELPKALAQEQSQERKKQRILLIDDDLECLRTLARLLKNDHREIVIAHSEERAIAHLKAEQIDLVISDHQMPGGGATHLFENVKELPPVVVLTGVSDKARHRELYSLGAERIFLKPVDPDEIVRYLEKLSPKVEGGDKESMVA